MIKVGLIDNEILFLDGLEELLQKEEQITVIKTYSNPTDLLADWEQNLYIPDILLIDIEMPNISGIELTKIITTKYPKVNLIGLSSHYSKVFIFEMLKLGASGYLAKNIVFDKLVSTIINVSERGFYSEDLTLQSFYNGTLRPKDEKDSLNYGLTNREIEVLQLICEQFTNQEIADILFISVKTVERHRTNLFEKTKAKNVIGVVLFALEKKLVLRLP